MTVDPATSVPSHASPPTSNSSGWRFSLSAIFVVTVLVAIGLGWWVNGPLLQYRAVQEIRRLGGSVVYSRDTSVSEEGLLSQQLHETQREEGWLSHEYFEPVIAVHIDGNAEEALQSVGKLTSLEALYISGNQTERMDISLIPGDLLKHLKFADVHLDAEGWKTISQFKRLRYLELARTNVDDDALHEFAKLPALKHLYLDGGRVTKRGLAAIGEMTRLTTLALDHLPITDADLIHLQSLAKLEELNLCGTEVHGEGLRFLQEMPLKWLGLNELSLDDKAIQNLSALKKLENLEVDFNRLSDSAAEQLLKDPFLRKICGITSVNDSGGENR